MSPQIPKVLCGTEGILYGSTLVTCGVQGGAVLRCIMYLVINVGKVKPVRQVKVGGLTPHSMLILAIKSRVETEPYY